MDYYVPHDSHNQLSNDRYVFRDMRSYALVNRQS